MAKNLPPSIRVEGGMMGGGGDQRPKSQKRMLGFGMGEAVVAQRSDLSLAFRVIMAA